MRIKRHDAVINYLKRNLHRQGNTVEIEPRFQTREGLRKPDIVASMGRASLVIDAQIVGDQVNLTDANKRKVDYYSKNESLSKLIKEKYRTTDLLTLGATINWRGVWGKGSADELIRRGVIRKSELKVISSRVLIGGLACWNIFNKVTSVQKNYRRGIG